MRLLAMNTDTKTHGEDQDTILLKIHQLLDQHQNALLLGENDGTSLLDKAYRTLVNSPNMPSISADDEIQTQDELRYEFTFARIEYLSGNEFAARKCLNRILRFEPEHELSHDLLALASDKFNPSKSLRDNGFRLLKAYRFSHDDTNIEKASKLAHRALKYMHSDAARLSMSKPRLHEDLARSFYLVGALYDASGDTEAALHMFDSATYFDPGHEPSERGMLALQGFIGKDNRPRDFG